MDLLLLSVAAFFTGLSKAGFGGGLGTLVAPLLSLRMPSRKVIGLLLPMLLASDVVNIFLFWGHWQLHHWLWVTPASALGIALGSRILRNLDERALRLTIGGVAVGFALLQLARDPRAAQPWWVSAYWFGASMGILAGLFSTLAHVGGVLVVMYLVTQGMAPVEFVATTTSIYVCQNTMKLYPYLAQKLITREGLIMNAKLAPLLLIGALIGRWLSHNVDPRAFNRVVLQLMLLSGAFLLSQTMRARKAVSVTMECVVES